MNLTFEHHEESRFNEAVFDALTAALARSEISGLMLQELYRVPGPVNAMFAVGIDVSRGNVQWEEVFSIQDWPDLPDPSPQAHAAALVATVRARLAEAKPPPHAQRRRSWWGRGR